MVLGMSMLWMVTGWVCPIRWIRAVVCRYWAGVQGGSIMSMFVAAVSVCPWLAAVMLMVMFVGFVFSWNLVFAVSVFWGFCPPIIMSPPVSLAMVCTMWRWWAAMTILCPCSLAFCIHSKAVLILACATIFRSSVSWMRVSWFWVAKCARIRAAVGFLPSCRASFSFSCS